MLLQMHRDGATHLHVLEDDVVLSKQCVSFLDRIILSGSLDDADILFTDTTMPLDLDRVRDVRRFWRDSVQRLDNGTTAIVRFGYIPYVACMTSYIVNRRSIQLICDIIARELEGDDPRPIDLLIRAKAAEGKLRAKCLFPFITSVRPDEPRTINYDEATQLSRLAVELLRQSFFVESDLKAMLELADRKLISPNAGHQELLHSRIFGFTISDVFRSF